jgi:hypothetical protein
VDDLEGQILELLQNAGGIKKNERRFIGALFNESSLGIALDIFMCIEGVLNCVERNAGRLYGYALVIGKNIIEGRAAALCRSFASPAASGVYCDWELQELFVNYFQLEAPAAGLVSGAGQEAAAYARLTAFKVPEGFGSLPPPGMEQARRINIVQRLKQERRKNVLILGPEFSGKRAGIYEFCAGGAPPLTVRFASGRGLAPVSDAYSPVIRTFLCGGGSNPADSLKPGVVAELDTLQGHLFRDRLHGEAPLILLQWSRRFFALLLDSYLAACVIRGFHAFLVLEDLDRAPESAALVVQEALRFYTSKKTKPPGKADFVVYGTALSRDTSAEASPGGAVDSAWDQLFPRIIRLEGEDSYIPGMARDLWEIGYAFTLLGRYFPGPLFPRLLTEGGKSPAMVARALDILSRSGLVDDPQDPRPRIRDFLSQAEAVLAERKDMIRCMVRDRLLDWAFSNRLRPCFALLEALTDLGNGAGVFKTIKRGDELILKSVLTDMANGTFAGIGRALEEGRLESIVGPERAFTVGYLFNTLKALLNGNDGDIREAFRNSPEEKLIYPPFKAQVLVNTAAYHLGVRDIDSALGTIKEAFVLSQNTPWSGLAQSNRLFSLVNLARQRMGETVEYAGFAVEHAEKSGDYGELALASYYAAAAQTMFGNLSRARHLAAAAENHAVQAGRAEWADRARFFQGKIAFDLGYYDDALQIFQDVAKNPAGNPAAAKLSLLEAWVYRARIYSRDPLLPKPACGGIDVELFEIEGAYLAGDYARTADLAAALTESLPGESFVYTEQPDWHSGFAQCELLLLPSREFWDRMVLVYRALALCRLSGGGAEAMKIMQRILRDERLSETDPSDAFYFYAWYQVLQESGAAQIDMNTAVSMAFKRLQRRASRIDDPKIRQVYLTQPCWNSALSLAAREHKLI